MPIGWGIVSTGRHPDIKMAPAINATHDATVAAVVSRSLGRAKAFAAKHRASAAYDDLDAMLSDSAVDVVYIASPNALHADQTIRAARAGKHVLVEKPMALSVTDAQLMINECIGAGVQLGVDFHLRGHDGHRHLRDLILNGELGSIALAEANWGRGTRGQVKQPPRTGLQAWWDDPALVGAGAFMATGVHCVDLLRFVLADEVTEVSVLSDATEGNPLEELLALSMHFRKGTIATVLTGRRTPDYERNDVVVYGTNGRGGVHGSIDMNLSGTLSVRTDAVAEHRRFRPNPLALYIKVIEAFNDAVKGNSNPLATGLDGLKVVEITAAMAESALQRRRVALL